MARSMKTMDGNHAAAHASYAYTEVAAIYPITPSSVMAEHRRVGNTRKKEYFGQTVQVTEMQSEAGAAGSCTRLTVSRCAYYNLHSFSGITA